MPPKTAYTERVIYIVTDADKANADLAALDVDPNVGEAFATPLWETGLDPEVDAATHHGCSWQMTEAQKDALPAAFDARGVSPTTYVQSCADSRYATPTWDTVMSTEGLISR